MAETDSGRMSRYKSKIFNVGQKCGIDPALIAAIISRESRAGNVLHDGWGDWNPHRNAYNAWGLMQVREKYFVVLTSSLVELHNRIQ